MKNKASLRLALVRAVKIASTIYSHADIPEAATLGKRKASSEHLARPEKKAMTVSDSELCYSPSDVANFVGFTGLSKQPLRRYGFVASYMQTAP